MTEQQLTDALRPHVARIFAAARAASPAATFSDAPDSPDAGDPTGFSAADLARFHDYYSAAEDGTYPGHVHRAFGCGIKAFADATGLRRRALTREGRAGWAWVPRADVTPGLPQGVPSVVSFADDPDDSDDGEPDLNAAIGAAMVELAHDAAESGDDPHEGLERLRALLHDPDALAEMRQQMDGDDDVKTFAAGWDESKHDRDHGKFAPEGGGGGSGGSLPEPSDKESCERIASALRDAVSDASGGDTRDWCVTTAEAIRSLYPDAEVWSGGYEGMRDDQAHTIVKLGGHFIDVTADQFGGPDVHVADELDEDKYPGFTPDDGTNSRPPSKNLSGPARRIADAVKSSLAARAFSASVATFAGGHKWNEDDHPRGKGGHFISKDRIAEAKDDPKLAEQLRKEVKPGDAEKLERALKGETDLGRTRRGEAMHAASKRREAKQTTREAAEGVIAKLTREGDLKGKVSADDLHALADHLQSGHMSVADLRRVKDAMRGATIKAGFGGNRTKDAMVRALVAHAKGEAFERRLKEQGVEGEDADAMRVAAGLKPKAPPAEPAPEATPGIPVKEKPIPTTGQLGAWGRAVDAAKGKLAKPKADGGKTVPKATRPPLTDDERKAIGNYTNVAYKSLNSQIRDGKPLSVANAATHAAMQSAFAKARPFKPPEKVRRAVNLDGPLAEKFAELARSAMEGGKVATMPGYVSTTRGDFAGDLFKHAPVNLTINAVQGLDVSGVSASPGEKEMLLNDKSRFRVKSVERVGDGWHIEMDQLPPSAAGEPEVSLAVPSGQAEDEDLGELDDLGGFDDFDPSDAEKKLVGDAAEGKAWTGAMAAAEPAKEEAPDEQAERREEAQVPGDAPGGTGADAGADGGVPAEARAAEVPAAEAPGAEPVADADVDADAEAALKEIEAKRSSPAAQAKAAKAKEKLQKQLEGAVGAREKQQAQEKDAPNLTPQEYHEKYGTEGYEKHSRDDHERLVRDAIGRGEAVTDHVTVHHPKLHQEVQDSRLAGKALRDHLESKHAPDAVEKVLASPQASRGMRTDEATGSTLAGFASKTAKEHHDAVARQVAAGKTVPPEVLADYPDLAAKATPPATPAKTRQQIADEITAKRKAKGTRSGAPDANPTAAEVEAAGTPAAARVPTMDAGKAGGTHEPIGTESYPTRRAAEDAARASGRPGVAVVQSAGAWVPVAPKGEGAASPEPAKAAGGPVSGLSDAEFAKKVQATADNHTHGFGDNKVYISDVYDKLKAEDPSLTREGFHKRLVDAARSGGLNLSRADLVQIMPADKVRDSEVERVPGSSTATSHFILAANKPRANYEKNEEREWVESALKNPGGFARVTPGLASKYPDLLEKYKPAPDMAMLDQPADAVDPGTRTGDAVARKENRQEERHGTPPKKTTAVGHPGIDAAIAAHATAPTPRVKNAIETALFNSGIENPAKPPKGFKADDRQLARTLASSHQYLHDDGAAPEEMRHLEQVMEAHGMRKHGEVGDAVRFDGQYHESAAPGAFTGHAHQIDRPGWTLPEAGGREYVASKSRTRPAGK